MDLYITEVTALQKADDIMLHFYEFPPDNEASPYEGVAHICRKWKWANGSMPVAYNQHTIVTLAPVKDDAGFKPLSHQKRPIDAASSFERALLERITKESILSAGQKQLSLKRIGNDLQEWEPAQAGDVLIYPALSFYVNIKNNRIHIGFSLTHKFEYSYTLQSMIDHGDSISPGLQVVHSGVRNNYTYTVEQIAPYSVMDTCPKLKKSIYDYYLQKGNQKAAAALNKNIRVIHAKPLHGDSLSYAATVLKPLCSFETMKPSEAVKVIQLLKMNPHERMKKQLIQAKQVLAVCPYLSFTERPFLIEANGYRAVSLKEPAIQMTKTHAKPFFGLKNDQLFQGGTMTLSTLFDEDIERACGMMKQGVVLRFIKVLQAIAKQHGVRIVFSSKAKAWNGKFTDAFFQQFDQESGALEDAFAKTTVLAIVTEAHLTKLPHSVYDSFKQQFGGQWDIASQVITEKTLGLFQRLLKKHNVSAFDFKSETECAQIADLVKNNSFIAYPVFNILLGLYVKSGMQPWVLTKPAHSDCFIGLDVSHEDGKSAAGIINVIGRNGHLLKQSALNGVLNGEKIDDAKLQNMLSEVLSSYKQQFGTLPQHVTIHRDGKWCENSALVHQLFSEHHVEYDIVEVIKKPNRRMACLNLTTNTFETKQGICYIRDNEAFLCSTNPHKSVGMAQPVKIVQKKGSTPIEKIIEDIYALSFMHIHAVNKMRLPATIHYADLSATAYQRGQIMPRTGNGTYLPFV